MPEIVPRWEWRTFGKHFGSAERTFADMESTGAQESDELYLLSAGPANVKVRDDLMDVKVLQSVNSDGLEQWAPAMKAKFPLTADDLVKVYQALGRPDTQGIGAPMALDELISDHSGLFRPVQVHKRRVRYTVLGCTSEVTDLVVDGEPARTIAIESEDPEAVVAAVRHVGLEGYFNTNYERGLTGIINGAPHIYGVIDVGTNSVKFHLAERPSDGAWKIVVDRAEVTRLGEGLTEGGAISPEAVSRTVEAIAGMVNEAKAHNANAIATVGTAGLRMASNGEEVVAEIKKRAGTQVAVISGEEESRLAYLAVKAGLGLDPGSLVVFDTGGGSTQFTYGRGNEVLERYSLNVGAVRYTERFGLDGIVSTGTLDEALAFIAEDLGLDGRAHPDVLVGMGGTITNVTAVSGGMAIYDPDLVQGAILTLAEVDRQIELYRTTPLEERRSIVGLQPKRAEVILAGACVVKTVMEGLGHQSLTVSDRGLRHGVLTERFGA